MAIRHVVTIQVAPGRAADFASAFKACRRVRSRRKAVSNTSCFKVWTTPEKVVLLERWASEELLDRHMKAERSRNRSAVDAVVALWAPGTTPTIERFVI